MPYESSDESVQSTKVCAADELVIAPIAWSSKKIIPRYINIQKVYAGRIQTQIQCSFKSLLRRIYWKQQKITFLINIIVWSVLPDVIYRSICRNSSFLWTLKSKKTITSVYGILNESLSPEHLKSYLINPNIFKYREFGELNVLVSDTKSNITSK